MRLSYTLYYTLNKNIDVKNLSESDIDKMYNSILTKINSISLKHREALLLLIIQHHLHEGGEEIKFKSIENLELPYGGKIDSTGNVHFTLENLPVNLIVILYRFVNSEPDLSVQA